ncbi:hypothetical protein MDA_GLEAN10010000 [Myotis davidii]|uniref:Uncharacterized protein n=1 Tax=Myotis davidii TaxID=225400 RepID=L5LPU1_MYODS|nr:hypothetical protein MDA_GLEAN10010000 [Myotis davidii]
MLPSHLLHHFICGAIDWSGPPTQLPQRLGAMWWPQSPLLLLVAICGAIDRAIGPQLAPALAWCHPLTCSTIPPKSRSLQGPLGPAAPPLPPALSSMSPMPAMFIAAP